MELQEYLRTNGLEQLVETYHINAVPHQQYPNLICLKYSMMDSPMGQIVARQSRGIIFDRDKDWEIISYPYDKFFNYGEGKAATIDWSSAKVYEKLDGSLMVLYYYDDKWQVSSSGTPDGAGTMRGCDLNFAQLFWQVWAELGYQLPTDIEHCYMFELMTKHNQVISIPARNRLALHGVRNIKSIAESEPKIWADKYGWELVKTYPFTNAIEIQAAAKLLNPIESEGYIVCDCNFNRVKIKSPQYVAIGHLMGGFSSLNLLRIIIANEGEEFLVYFPEWTDIYQQLKTGYRSLIVEIESNWHKYKDIPVQKDFALTIKDLPYQSILFALRGGKIKAVKDCLGDEPVHKTIDKILTADKLIQSQIAKL
jgi:RNA ligase